MGINKEDFGGEIKDFLQNCGSFLLCVYHPQIYKGGDPSKKRGTVRKVGGNN